MTPQCFFFGRGTTFLYVKNAQCGINIPTQSKCMNKTETKQKQRPMTRSTDQVSWPFTIQHGGGLAKTIRQTVINQPK